MSLYDLNNPIKIFTHKKINNDFPLSWKRYFDCKRFSSVDAEKFKQESILTFDSIKVYTNHVRLHHFIRKCSLESN